MEHLTRNANNERIIYTLEELKAEKNQYVYNKMDELVDKIINICVGICSSIVSGTLLVVVGGNSKESINIVILIALFIVIFLVLWYTGSLYGVPFFYNQVYKKRIKLPEATEENQVKRFNSEIIQKVAELTEIVEVMEQTDITVCKQLNFVVSLFKLHEIVDFMYDNFYERKVKIRKDTNDGTIETFKYDFNIYNISAVKYALKNICNKMNNLAKNSIEIQNLDGYSLLIDDLNKICDKINTVWKNEIQN